MDDALIVRLYACARRLSSAIKAVEKSKVLAEWRQLILDETVGSQHSSSGEQTSQNEFMKTNSTLSFSALAENTRKPESPGTSSTKHVPRKILEKFLSFMGCEKEAFISKYGKKVMPDRELAAAELKLSELARDLCRLCHRLLGAKGSLDDSFKMVLPYFLGSLASRKVSLDS
ncbi:hypothetical protein HDU83_003530 [Entophlyctis luteolus]|nr:hypothetical protein HDU83_003530 [Entophlyctis luteolus]